eukprot:CFRG4418T1
MLAGRRLGFVFACLMVLLQVLSVHALYEGMYCGTENCYDVLGVKRGEIDKKELGKICRTFLRKFHPDKNQDAQSDPVLKAQLQKDWEKYNVACETIRDEQSRKDYDYLLDNPDEFFYNWWFYHRPRVSTQVDAGLVIFCLLTLISLGQYYFINQSFDIQIHEILFTEDKLRHELNARAEREGHGKLLKNEKGKPLPKDELKQVLFNLYADDIGLSANIDRCEWTDVLWVRIFMWAILLPIYIFHAMKFFMRHVIMNSEYSDGEKEYMTRKRMLISRRNWKRHTQEYKDELIARELWKEECWKQYKEDQEKQMAEYYLSDSEMKRYKKQKKRQ